MQSIIYCSPSYDVIIRLCGKNLLHNVTLFENGFNSFTLCTMWLFISYWSQNMYKMTIHHFKIVNHHKKTNSDNNI